MFPNRLSKISYRMELKPSSLTITVNQLFERLYRQYSIGRLAHCKYLFIHRHALAIL